MSHGVTVAVTGLLVLAAAVWVGGFVAIVVVARVARRMLQPPARVALFRGLGRAYGVVGLGALTVAYGTGGALLYGRAWTAQLTAVAVLAAALAVATGTGVAQARRMSRLRRAAVAGGAGPGLTDLVRRGAVAAGVLRSLIGLLSLALLAMGVALGG